MSGSPQHTLGIDQAAASLRAGGVVVLPSETIYGIYARAGGKGEGLRSLLDMESRRGAKSRDYPWTWHAPSRERLEEALPLRSPLHKRVVRVLMPGPVRLQIEHTDHDIDQALRVLDVAPGIIDGVFPGVPGRALAVRVPEHEISSQVLERVAGVVVAESAAALGLGDGASLPPDVSERANSIGIGAVVDDGPTRYGMFSTPIRLLAGGGYRIMASGAIDEREVRRRIERRILFVCSGNTCRSPVAEAIARSLLAERSLPQGQAPVPTTALSAGTAAASGLAMTSESARALEEMGIEPGRHSSRPLTRDMLLGADYVFAMTRQHQKTIEMMSGSLAKVALLDPGGAEIEDPIGGPLKQYREMAKAVRRAIERRLAEIEEGDMQ